jgi:hypothetical protein
MQAQLGEMRDIAHRIQGVQHEITTSTALHQELLQRFGEAREATVDARTAGKAERMRQKEAASVATISSLREEGRIAPVPVMDMHFCMDNLDAIRSEAGDFTLRDFSDYWAPDNRKITPNGPNKFVPNRLVSGSNPLWAPFYDRSLTRQGTDGSLEADPDHPPFFRASQELLGRMLHNNLEETESLSGLRLQMDI